MTSSTSRHNIKPILFGISFMMMIFFCLMIPIMALQGVGPWQYSRPNSIVCSISCFNMFGMPILLFGLFYFNQFLL